MHHKNHKNSSANHNNPAHHKPKVPSAPAPQTERKSRFQRLRERFQEKPATKEEVMQLGLNAKREVYKTQIQRAKSARPSRFSGFGGGGGGSSRRSSSRRGDDSGSWLMGESGGGSFGNFVQNSGQGPSLGFLTGANQKPARRGKQESSFGSGLTDLF